MTTFLDLVWVTAGVVLGGCAVASPNGVGGTEVTSSGCVGVRSIPTHLICSQL
ncbi:MAG: hypothetical protein ISP33_01740 [Ilumatobacteraceae bacterium]|nr:hypothetical protein [Ilumatobacteraceae bacterium]